MLLLMTGSTSAPTKSRYAGRFSLIKEARYCTFCSTGDEGKGVRLYATGMGLERTADLFAEGEQARRKRASEKRAM
jgi:hypothetical protein